jgi:nucleoside-diphosphate-sugar epimerase
VTRVLVTGHDGYIGSVMAPALLDSGYDVVGVDTGYFRTCTLVPDSADPPAQWKDIRDLEPADLEGFDAVIHLAALSNDPIGSLNDSWTEEINFRASVRLATLARAAGVKRFLFSSSCIMYGISELAVVDETAPLDPQTEYARSKVRAERAISQLADASFSPTFLRNGTIYGMSPRMRFDTVFNNLIGSAVATQRIVVHGDGTPWRPVVHVSDVARAFITVLEAAREEVHNQAFNTGAAELNCQVGDLARIAAETVPGCDVVVLGEAAADRRTYQADFGKFARTFPHFQFTWTPATGARELYDSLSSIGLNEELFTDGRFTRLAWLSRLIDTRTVNEALRWSAERAGAPA